MDNLTFASKDWRRREDEVTIPAFACGESSQSIIIAGGPSVGTNKEFEKFADLTRSLLQPAKKDA